MQLANLISLCRLKVPAAPANVISDANITVILNEGVKEIVRKTKCLPTYARFNTVANQMEYNLSTLITNYLCPLDEDLQRVYYYDGNDYTELDIITLSYLDENYSDWQTATAGAPERCVILGDILYLHPKPATVITNGIKFYYCKKPPEMGGTNIYPFGGTSEISRLSVYHSIIAEYYQWQAYEILDKEKQAVKCYQKYQANLAIMKSELSRDMTMMLLRKKKTKINIPDYLENPF